MSGTIIIQGAPIPDSVLPAAPARREINDLIGDQRQFSLYVQAVARLQQVAQTNPVSWFGVAGIHGLPQQNWDNASPKPRQGYCVHGLPLFPTWHRPYVTLYEQALQAQAAAIANEYTFDQELWKYAAGTLRAPYWDWALYLTPPVQLYESQTLRIITKDGPTDFPNPLLAYTFNPGSSSPVSGRTKTYRASGMIARLESARNLRTDVYKTLTLIKNWTHFSNHTASGGVASSLETLHDGMHNRIGGGGFMSNPSVAAFDPIFWLHHANVDRQLALWQAINPTVWVGQNDLNTNLSPFWNTSTTFHRSSGAPVKKWTDFKFNYPEFIGLEDASQQEIQSAISNIVRDMYGPDRPRGGTDENFTEWYVRIHSQTYALGGSYSIFLFFNEPPQSAEDWRSAENMIGASEVFANPNPEECPNCVANLDSLHEAVISITEPLQMRGKYQQEVEKTKAYVKDNLKWRVQKIDGSVVSTDNLPGFDIRVETSRIKFSTPRDGTDGPIPTAGEPQEQIHF